MQINLEAFLLVAEELSISRAAERMFVTQQCVSDHIKRLEAHYQVQLFTRKPRFQLTQHGQELLSALRIIRQMENSLEANMQKRAAGERGSFSVGISSSRAQIILPWTLPAYARHYPDIQVDFLMNDTLLLEESLLRGEIDLFLGVNTRYNETFSYVPVCEDDICVVLSDQMLRQCSGAGSGLVSARGIDLELLTKIPFSGCYATSVINNIVKAYLDDRKVNLDFRYNISDTTTQIELCRANVCAAIIPRMLLSNIPRQNLYCPKEQYLYVFPLPASDRVYTKLRIEMVLPKLTSPPKYVLDFQRIMTDTIRAQNSRIWNTGSNAGALF